MNRIRFDRVGLVLAALMLFAAPTGFSLATAQSKGWPPIQSTEQEKKVLADFRDGPYGPMASGRVARQTLVAGTYALMDPQGKYSAIYTDYKITRMKNGGSPWMDIASGKPLSATQVRSIRQDMIKRIDKSDAIKFTYGTGGNDAVLISAYDCPYCKKMEQALDAGNVNSTLYVLPMALQHNRPAPMAKARDIWCSPDAAKAWKAMILKNQTPAPAPASCKQDPRKSVELMHLFDIKGVPTRIFADGRILQGGFKDL